MVKAPPYFESSDAAVLVDKKYGTCRDGCEPKNPDYSTTEGNMELFKNICEDALQTAANVSPAAKLVITEDLRLRHQFPGEYVAYIDKWVVKGNERKLLRKVLAHSTELRSVHTDLANQPKKRGRCQPVVDYVEPIGGDLQVPHDISDR